MPEGVGGVGGGWGRVMDEGDGQAINIQSEKIERETRLPSVLFLGCCFGVFYFVWFYFDWVFDVFRFLLLW